MDAPHNLIPLTPLTLVDRVVESIVHAAATGIFLPGDRIVEADVARRLNVSRVPVREALRLLESQGILVNVPYRGMRLIDVSADRLRKILEVRLALEKFAAFMLQDRVQREPTLLDPLDRISASMRLAADAGDRFGIAKFETEFHRTLLELTGNEILVATWEPLSCQLTIIFGLSTLQNDMVSIAEEHVELTEVIRSGDRRKLDRTLKLHILDSPQDIDFEAIIAGRRGQQGESEPARLDPVRRRARPAETAPRAANGHRGG